MLAQRIEGAMTLTDALAASRSAEELALHNGAARSNSIGAQFWCLVGARESYAAAIRSGEWQGFACSLGDPMSPGAVQSAMASARSLVMRSLEFHADDERRSALVFDLLEHEVQHHGQLIRFFYANDIPFPVDFASRYAVG